MKTPEERLADLYVRAATTPREVVTFVSLTSSGALHHCYGAKPGAFGVVARMPHLDRPVPCGVVYIAVAESSYVEPVLGNLLVAALADLEANAREPSRRVAEARFESADPITQPGVQHLVLSLEPNMEDFIGAFARGAALLQRPFADIEQVPFLRGTVAGLELLYPRFRRDESAVQLILRAMREKPLEELCQGFEGRLWSASDGKLLHGLAIYLRACAEGGLLAT